MGCGASKITGDKKAFLDALRAKHHKDEAPDPDAAAKGCKFLRSGVSLKRIIEKNSVLVVVRVRPLSDREIKTRDDLEAVSPVKLAPEECVKVINSKSLVCSGKQFTYDACFNEESSQTEVYERSGRMVLGKVLEGFNGCVFAYGQTGSGKTYTMTGTNKHPGVIPQLCAELFERVSALRKEGKCVEVRVQMCEIYNEKLKDLAHDDARDLAIREDSAPGGRGIYVDGLSSHVADDARSVLALVEDGSKRRAIGQTDMNAHSSRSHAVVTLHIESWDKDDEERFGLKRSELHLIDLAGSERQKSTNAEGGRLKEGAAINLSLTALGNVISALTEGANRSHVPYRDSKLTRLLQNSLGGNSVTVMLCNASPAQLNAEETTSALQFAARTKKIENHAAINRDPKLARAAALYEENQLLRDKVRRLEAHVAELEKNYYNI